MASYTAQILVGTPHTYHDGIIPTHQLFLSENSRPAWILIEMRSGKTVSTWIPSVDHMLEDGLAMIAACVLRDPGVLSIVPSPAPQFEISGISAEEHQKLVQVCRGRKWEPKLVITVLKGSCIGRQLRRLARYQVEREVCRSSGIKGLASEDGAQAWL